MSGEHSCVDWAVLHLPWPGHLTLAWLDWPQAPSGSFQLCQKEMQFLWSWLFKTNYQALPKSEYQKCSRFVMNNI